MNVLQVNKYQICIVLVIEQKKKMHIILHLLISKVYEKLVTIEICQKQ